MADKHTSPTGETTEAASQYDDELLTIAEAAAVLKVTPKTVRNYIRAGRLEVVTYSRKVRRIRRSALDAARAA